MPGLQLLMVEDNPDDADLLLRELRRAGFDPTWSRVETEPDFLAALQNPPEIILSDYSMPHFSGLRALELLRASGRDIPFILISGTVGEDVAVQAMRDGATDYLLKDRPARLASAVKRALAETQLRAEHHQAEAAQARLAATYPEVFTRAWADHEAMLAGLDDLEAAAGRMRAWVTAKHHAMS
jgi:hypothetical protein